jgi:hypothetical protein
MVLNMEKGQATIIYWDSSDDGDIHSIYLIYEHNNGTIGNVRFDLSLEKDQLDLDYILKAAGCKHYNTEPLALCLNRLYGKIINLDFLKNR